MTNRYPIFSVALAIVFLSHGLSYSQDDTTKKDKLIQITGSAEIGMEYGLLPFLINNIPPQSNFKSEGNFGVEIAEIPLQVNYFYSSLGTLSGLNNYFHIQFDAEKYKQQIRNKVKQKEVDQLNELQDLELKRQEYLKKLNYLEMVKDPKINVPYQLPDTAGIKNGLMSEVPDTSVNLKLDTSGLQNDIQTAIMDSISGVTDSIQPKQPDKIQEVMMWSDSLEDEYKNLKSKLDEVNGKIEEIEAYQRVNQDSLLQNSKLPDEYYPKGYGKIQKLLSYIKNFEIGMCYPNYSTFLVANVPVRGINIEIQKNKLYGAVTYGTTLNNIFFTNNLVENNLNAQRNLFNFFDFQKVENGRKILAFKAGYGEKESNHFFIGGLYGKGKTSYIDSNSVASESNIVLEVDGKLIVKKDHQINLLYGRSTVQANNVNYDESSYAFNNLFDFSNRSNAVLLKSKHIASKTATSLELTYRYIEPFFKSFGLGFIRSDNQRYQVKIKQKIFKTLSAQVFYRKEQDNVLNLYSNRNVLQSYGASMTFRPTRKLFLKADYRPVLQNTSTTGGNDSVIYQNKNYILNVIGNYGVRIRETYYRLTGIYSYYQLFNGEYNNRYQNINGIFTITKKQLQFSASYNRFLTSDTASIQNAQLYNAEINCQIKKVQFSAKGKMAVTEQNNTNFGYGGMIRVNISKLLSWELSGEKLVFGDFYNSLSLVGYEDFPYFVSSKIRLTF